MSSCLVYTMMLRPAHSENSSRYGKHALALFALIFLYDLIAIGVINRVHPAILLLALADPGIYSTSLEKWRSCPRVRLML